MTLHSQGLSYSSINTARSALSSILKLDNCDNFGTHPLVTRFMKGNLRVNQTKAKVQSNMGCLTSPGLP